jgi:opacity protein-like surface antigen
MKHLLLALALVAILATPAQPAQAQPSPATDVTRKAHQLLGKRSGGIMCYNVGTVCNVALTHGTWRVYFDANKNVKWDWIPRRNR